MGRSASKEIPSGPRKKVLVLGGGYGGTQAAKLLDELFDVTLVDRQDYSTHTMGLLRAIANRNFAPLVLVPFDKLLKNGKLLQGEITEISDKSVNVTTLDGDITLTFDYLIIATGTPMAFPSRPIAIRGIDAIQEIESCNTDVASASKILIVGGGAVGVELASEIKFSFPSKSVTIVHNGDRLVANVLTPKFYTNLNEKLAKLGVEVRLNERVKLPAALSSPGRTYYRGQETSVWSTKGTEYRADMIFKCIGRLNGNAHLKYFSGKGALENSGRLRVDEFLKVDKIS